MGQRKEALRASIEAGPRAALTWRGGPRVPEPSEKHGLGEGRAISPLREMKRSGASERWRGAIWPAATRQAENSSKNASDSLLTLQPIGGRQFATWMLQVFCVSFLYFLSHKLRTCRTIYC